MESVEEEREWEVEPIVYVNGVRRVLPDDSAHLTLLQYLRGKRSSPKCFPNNIGILFLT